MQSGQTALIKAAINNHINVVVTMIDSGADLDIQDKVGQHATKYSYSESEFKCFVGMINRTITSNDSH